MADPALAPGLSPGLRHRWLAASVPALLGGRAGPRWAALAAGEGAALRWCLVAWPLAPSCLAPLLADPWLPESAAGRVTGSSETERSVSNAEEQNAKPWDVSPRAAAVAGLRGTCTTQVSNSSFPWASAEPQLSGRGNSTDLEI